MNQKPDIAAGLEGLGIIALDRKAYDQAQKYFRKSLHLWTEIGNEPEIATLICRSGHCLLASASTDTPRIRGLFAEALRLSHKHQAGTIAITAMVGLAVLQIKIGESNAPDPDALKLLLYAWQHPATPQETRSWVESFLGGLGIDLSQSADPLMRSIAWQSLAEDWERQFSTA